MTGDERSRGAHAHKRLLRLDRDEAAHRALDEEIALHLELRVEQLVARGMLPAAAHAEALRRFGGDGSAEGFQHATRILHQSAERREDRMRLNEQLTAVARDVSYAWRSMRRAPGFALAAVVTLALGIGANTAVFGVVNAALLRPLPYAQPARLVMVWNHWTNWPQTWLSQPETYDYGQRREVFASFAAYTTGAVNLGGQGEPERARAGFVTAQLLPTVGVHAFVGRNFTADEDRLGGPNVALLDYALWQRRYAGDPAIVGKQIDMSGVSRTIVGILPPDFRLPSEFAGEHAQVYLPIQLGPPSENQRGSHFLLAVARLQPGVTTTAANARLGAFIDQFKKSRPDAYGPEFGATLVPLNDEIFAASRKVLLLLFGAVAFVLLIGCANVANLLLSRAEARQREIAIRAALGAGRRRLARQLMTESLLLGLIGGALAVPVAMLSGPALVRLGAASLPRADATGFDSRALLFTLGVSAITSLLFGLAPALHALRGDLHDSLRASRGNSGGGGIRLRQVIVTVQVALAVVSVAGATLMARSFETLMSVAVGFKGEHVLTMRVSLPAARYRLNSSMQNFYAEAVARMRRLPGVTAAGAINALPLTGQLGDWGLMIEGHASIAPGDPGPAFDWQTVTDGYFEAMGIPVTRGRPLTAADARGGEPVVVISEETAKRWWPDVDPIGHRIKLGGPVDSLWRTVVGVVADVHHEALDKPVRSEMYLPNAQFPSTLPDSILGAQNALTFVIRAAGDPTALARTARGAIHAMDPQLAVAQVRTLDDVVSTSVSTPRLAMLLLGTFGALALILSAIGVYGVMSYGVARRTKEIGIRIALGARTTDVARLVVRQGMRPAVAGLALGVMAALSGARLMRGLLFGVSETDPKSLVLAVLVLGVVGLMATVLPGRRVSRVDPVAALRSD